MRTNASTARASAPARLVDERRDSLHRVRRPPPARAVRDGASSTPDASSAASTSDASNSFDARSHARADVAFGDDSGRQSRLLSRFFGVRAVTRSPGRVPGRVDARRDLVPGVRDAGEDFVDGHGRDAAARRPASEAHDRTRGGKNVRRITTMPERLKNGARSIIARWRRARRCRRDIPFALATTRERVRIARRTSCRIDCRARRRTGSPPPRPRHRLECV